MTKENLPRIWAIINSEGELEYAVYCLSKTMGIPSTYKYYECLTLIEANEMVANAWEEAGEKLCTANGFAEIRRFCNEQAAKAREGVRDE